MHAHCRSAPRRLLFGLSKDDVPVGVKQTKIDQRLLRSQAPQRPLGVAQPALGSAPARSFHTSAEMKLAVMLGDSGKKHQRMIGDAVLDKRGPRAGRDPPAAVFFYAPDNTPSRPTRAPSLAPLVEGAVVVL